jgi:phosphohistidine phosphatase
MKTIYVIRHAKSSWDDLALDDFDRPLNERGKRDVPRMAKRLKEKEPAIDTVISSPANRAITTAKGIADILQLDATHIRQEPRLYHASAETMLTIVQKLTDKVDTIMLVGHNPGLTDFVNELTGESIANVPTCGMVAITFTASEWSAIRWNTGKLLFFDYPKAVSA